MLAHLRQERDVIRLLFLSRSRSTVSAAAAMRAECKTSSRRQPEPIIIAGFQGSVRNDGPRARFLPDQSTNGVSIMNSNTIKGNWEQIKGNVQKKWGEITNDELDQIAGDRKILAGKIQEKYGRAQDEAEREIDEFERSY
jgi:uncharacterized protein YjbJ (UPF0337 family)